MKIPKGLAQQALKLEKNKPGVLFGVGIIGSVASTVLACRGTLKIEETLERGRRDLEISKNMDPEEFGPGEQKKVAAYIVGRTAVEVTRLYAPAVIIGGLSIAALTRSHNILNDRVTGLTAAYTALDKAYSEYRSRVVEKYGEDVDNQLRFPREKAKETNPETGREHTIEVVGQAGLDASPYARFFDETCRSWQKEAEYNLTFLKNQQNWFNDMLKMRRHVFLNEVYDALGIPRSSAGAVVGWAMDSKGDNYIDFGIFDAEDAVKRLFVNGYEGAILLDFNVDGVIVGELEKMEQVS